MDDEDNRASGHSTPSDASSINTTDQEKAEQQTGQASATAADSLNNVNLPYRTLNDNAIMREYTRETQTGLERVKSTISGRPEEYHLVTFKDADPENPKNWSKG